MTTIGPYYSIWSPKPQFIVKTTQGIFVITEGQQPHEGVPVLNIKDAKWWLKRNGYSLKKS